MSNKDEALRARNVAEYLMSQADFTAARIYAMKAQEMDASPENDDVSLMIMVCNVHCAALEKSGDETDWYKILQVDQNADDNAIKTQYKKLALQVHPDKNNFPGADSACKIIGEAKSILLDTDKRMRHDMKRKPVSRRPAPAPSFKPQQAPTKEGFRAKSSGTSAVNSNRETTVESLSSDSSGISNSSGTSETIVVSSDSECEEYEEVPQAQPTGFGGGSTKEGFRAKSSSTSAVNNSGKRKRKTIVESSDSSCSERTEKEFEIVVSKSSSSYIFHQYIGIKIASKYFPKEKTTIKIHHPDRERSWDVDYVPKPTGHGIFAHGWTNVRSGYPVAPGDTLKFTLINENELLLTI